MITRHDVAQQVIAYLQHRLSLAELVDWAEQALLESDLDERDLDLVRESLARLGVADVRAFGLSWEECKQLLTQLGYKVNVQVVPMS
ncbi:MAG: hypothetical protein RMJ96_05985 [Candidatus Bipolaricaulota bacterium]|nr:hypothetical protein [Candidatus Bipolaricaulota bacterium]MDW8329748.1 hypothetical protein [Candidatus Bipolaricaulota bacterium]